MPLQLREFTLDPAVGGIAAGTGNRPAHGAGASVSSAQLAGILQPEFQITAGRPTAVRRVWLDTFDSRLHRAGITLEYISRRGGEELALVTREGARTAATVPKMTWPGLAGRIPDTRLRERLEPITGIRALIPVLSSTGTRRDLRVLDAEAKTVARLTVDDAVLEDTAAVVPSRLTLTAVRGYGAHGGRIGRRIGDLAGIEPADGSALDAALAAAGRNAGGYTSQMGIKLAASTPAGPALASLLLRLLDIAEANVDGIIRDIDTEFLHDLRIAVRRTRAALKLAGDALPAEMAARFAPEFRWLGQLTTRTRDLDVHLLGFDHAAARLVTAAPDDLTPLHTSLLRYRAAERRRLTQGLRSGRFAHLTGDWRAALSEVATASGTTTRQWADTTRLPIASLAAARIRRAHRRLVKSGSAVTPTSPEVVLHTVRKRGKELRYLLEFFASMHEPATHRKTVRTLKRLQDCLGEIQDGHVQREVIRALAARMTGERAAPAATLLAMGELAAQLDAAAGKARGDYARRFAEFTSDRNTRRIAHLTEAAA